MYVIAGGITRRGLSLYHSFFRLFYLLVKVEFRHIIMISCSYRPTKENNIGSVFGKRPASLAGASSETPRRPHCVSGQSILIVNSYPGSDWRVTSNKFL